MSSRFVVFAVACMATTAALADPPSLRQSELRKITVDAAVTVGTLRSLQGVDGAPGPGGHKPENFKFGGWIRRPPAPAISCVSRKVSTCCVYEGGYNLNIEGLERCQDDLAIRYQIGVGKSFEQRSLDLLQ